MIRREDFIDALGMPDEGFTNAVDAALRQVKEGEARPVMKRKMTLTLLAAVLTVIVLTGAALAVGLNLFDHFGRNDRRLQVVAPEAALMVNDAVEVTTDGKNVTDVKVLESSETVGVGAVAVEWLPARIVEANSIDVDGITGATITSDAIKTAVREAMDKAA